MRIPGAEGIPEYIRNLSYARIVLRCPVPPKNTMLLQMPSSGTLSHILDNGVIPNGM
jgi:hypothetical protein